VTGANIHDVSQLDEVLKQKIINPISVTIPENLCADAGYTGKRAMQTILSAGYIPHVRGRIEEKQELTRNPLFKARRWIVESCHSWFNRFRKLTIRYEKQDRTHLALLHLAASIIALRKIGIIYG
jgi:transposase